jgi:sigma-B regulation protein RsbU (phosphoserine phosphatase)
MKVLVAEDDPISAQVLQKYLEQWGHEVLIAEDGADAWDLVERDGVALVISDWMMPRMDGVELVRRIRATPRPGYVYVILLTAKSKKEDIVRGMEAGADDFLIKPFDREELRVRLRAGERIVELEQRLARRNEELQTANTQITSANRRMKSDMEAAARVQHALLPAALPAWAGVRFAWTFQPCEELGGDMFGVVALDDRHAALYLLDVSGHGVAAALLSVSIRHFLTPLPGSGVSGASRSGQALASPKQVAAELNRRFPMDAVTGQFFTLMYGILDLQTHEFRYASAGHPGPLHLPRGAAPALLTSSGLPIGVSEEPRFEEHVLGLHPGDRLYLYSDGIPEAFNAVDEQFGSDRLVAALDEGRTRSLQESVSTLVADIERWCGERHLTDDVSVLAVEVAARD